ncbi:MAG: hypothetical protein WCD04_08065 [Terriglobia bacterium]
MEYVVVGADHVKKVERVAQMEITPLEGDNVFSGGRNLHPECLKPTLVHCSILPMRSQAEAGAFSSSPIHRRIALAGDAILRRRKHSERPAALFAGGVHYHRSGKRRGSQHAQQHWVADHYSELIPDMLIE